MDNTVIIIVVVVLIIVGVIVGIVLMRKKKESFGTSNENEPAYVSYKCLDENNWVMTRPIGDIYTRMSSEFTLSNTPDMQSSIFSLFDSVERPTNKLSLNADKTVALNGQLTGLTWLWLGGIIVVSNPMR